MNKPVDGITAATAKPKVRSRAGGAAIPLDETDRRLMNLLQSSFPLEPEPFALIASEAELSPEDVTLYLSLCAAQWPAVGELDRLWRSRG